MKNKVVNFYTYESRQVIFMCTILRNLHGKTAYELLNEYGVYDTIPIDLTKLADAIGISVLPMDFTSLEEKLNKKDILGLVLTKGEDVAIFYRKTDKINRIRFTIAHELAHCCHFAPDSEEPHVEYRIDEAEKDENEKQMDIFAGELLIPFNKLKEVYMNLSLPTSPVLAEKFGVSVQVMEARLNYLKISHYNKEKVPVFYDT